MGRVDAEFGWAEVGGAFLDTHDGGASWQGTGWPAPPTFFDRQLGWGVSTGPGSTAVTGSSTDVLHLVVHRTADGGASWTSVTLPGNYAGTTAPQPAFLDRDRGLLLLGRARFGLNAFILITRDGGRSWQLQAAISEPVLVGPFTFLDTRRGWGVGSGRGAPPTGDRLFATEDGGRSWRAVTLSAPTGFTSSDLTSVDAPHFVGGVGLVWASYSSAERSATTVYASRDEGRTWALAATRLADTAEGAAPDLLAFLGRDRWLLTGSGRGLLATDDGGKTWTTLAAAGLDGSPSSVAFVGPENGWALASGGGCAGFKTDCQTWAHLFASADGGQSWRLLKPVASG